MSRCLLHINKLDKFKAFLDRALIPYREGRGDWQVLQVYLAPNWLCVYHRLDMVEHYTTDRRLDNLMLKFFKQKEAA